MKMTTSQFSALKSWYLRHSKNKAEASDPDLSDTVFKKAVEVLEKKLDKRADKLALMIDNFNTNEQSTSANELLEYFDAVLKNKKGQIRFELKRSHSDLISNVNDALKKYVPSPPSRINHPPIEDNDAVLKQVVDDVIEDIDEQIPVAVVQPIAETKPVEAKMKLHASVNAVLRKFSATKQSLFFPGTEENAGLTALDYSAFMQNLAMKIAMTGLTHLILTHPTPDALQGLAKFIADGGEIKINHLHLNLDNIVVNDQYINSLVAMLMITPLDDIGEVKLEGEKLDEAMMARLVQQLIANNIAVNVTLPSKFSHTSLQRDLDNSIGNAKHALRVSGTSNQRLKKDQQKNVESEKRYRARAKNKSANVEVELQQQQAVETLVEHRAELDDEKVGDLNIITFEKLVKAIDRQKLPIALDKLMLTRLDLTKAWNSWFGHIATYQTLLTDGSKTITTAEQASADATQFNFFDNNLFKHITAEACAILLENPNQFKYGLDYQHLPAGFQLLTHPNGEDKVLHYNADFALIPSSDNLAIKLKKPMQVYIPSDNSIAELLAAFANHPNHALVTAYFAEYMQSNNYDREAAATIKKLVPKMFLYNTEDLKHILLLSKADGHIRADYLQIFINNHDKEPPRKFNVTDPGFGLITSVYSKKDIVGEYAQEHYEKIVRLKPVLAQHPLLLVLAKVDPSSQQKIQKWLRAGAQDENIRELDGLYDVYSNYGINALNKIVDLSKQYGESFNSLRASLSYGSNYLQLIDSQASLRVVDTICGKDGKEFNAIELEWLRKLIHAHAKGAKEFNLVDLVNSFRTFAAEIKKYGFEFYPNVEFADVQNMQVALARMLSILKFVPPDERKTQWLCMTGISLAADGAIFAVQNNPKNINVCNIVVPEMDVQPLAYGVRKNDIYNTDLCHGDHRKGYQGNLGFQDVSLHHGNYIDQGKRAINRELLNREFYRYVAYQKYHRPISEYPALLDLIASKHYKPEIEIILVRILAETSSGKETNQYNENLSSQDYYKLFQDIINLVDSTRLSVLQMQSLSFMLNAAKLVNKDAVRDAGAPHNDYDISSLIKYKILQEGFWDSSFTPDIVSIRTLLFMTSNALKNMDIKSFVSGESRTVAAKFIDRIKFMVDSSRILAFCSGMKYFTENEVDTLEKCAKYVDACISINGLAGYERVDREIGLNVIAIISTFNLRDVIVDYYNANQGNLIDPNYHKSVAFALALLRDIDLEIGRENGMAALSPQQFYDYVEKMLVLVRQPHYTNAQSIELVKNTFGRYFPEKYFDKYTAKEVNVQLKPTIMEIFASEADQRKCLSLLESYRDPKDVENYDNFFQTMKAIAKHSDQAGLASLLEQIVNINAIYLESGQVQPDLSAYIELLKLVDANNAANILVYFVSSTQKEIAALQGNDAGLHRLRHHYLDKINCFMSELMQHAKSKPESVLSEMEILKFISQFLNDSKSEQVARNDFQSPQQHIFQEVRANLLSDQALERYANDPLAYIEQVESALQARPELSLIPEMVQVKQHLHHVIKEQALAADAATTAAEAAKVAAEQALAVKKSQNIFQRGFNFIKEKIPTKKDKQVKGGENVGGQILVVAAPVVVDRDVITTARTAVDGKIGNLNFYSGVVGGIIDDMSMLVTKYPAIRKEITDFVNAYCSDVQSENGNIDEAIANVIYLRQLFYDIKDQKIVFALCFHFNNSIDKNNHAPTELVRILNDDKFKQLSASDKKTVLNIFVKLLNNEIIPDLTQFTSLLQCTPEQIKQIKSLYIHAPFPSLDKALEWVKTPETFHEKYKQYQILPSKRECAADEPNGFKLDVAMEKAPKIVGIEISKEELELLDVETKRVRDLDIEQLKGELQRFKEMKDVQLNDLATLVALTAELLYRAKGTDGNSFEINTTQYLAIYSMLSRGEHVTAEIGTGEGKTRIMMIMVASQYALGKTVDFITSDISLANREFTEFQSYFDLIGAESRLIHADSPANHYALNGINFSDPASIELFRNHAHSEGLSHLVIQRIKALRAMLLDEGDRTYFDLSNTRFNFSAASDASLKNVEWIYPLLTAFVLERDAADKTKYRYDDLDIDAQVLEFMHYIQQPNGRVPGLTADQFGRILSLPQQQLEGWIEAALTARDLKIQRDFVIDKDLAINTAQGPKIASDAKLIVGFRKDNRSKFSFGVHQCLHARLNLELQDIKDGKETLQDDPALKDALQGCTQKFHIEDEKQIVYTSSSKSLLDSYDQGSLYAVTGTAGSVAEREEARRLYSRSNNDPKGQMHFIDIPRHRELKRKDMPVRLVANDKQEVKFLVVEIMKSRARNQPTMIVCADDAECERINKGIREYMEKHSIPLESIFVVDSKTDLQEEARLVKGEIGKAKAVTITTPKLGRGVDIKIHDGAKEFGLKTIPTGNMYRHRDYFQVIARAGRFGAAGESRVILNKARLKIQLGKSTLKDGFYTSPQSYIRKHQAQVDRREQVKRLIMLTYTDYCMKMQGALYENLLEAGAPPSAIKAMGTAWQAAAAEINLKWNAIYDKLSVLVEQKEVDLAAVDALFSEMNTYSKTVWHNLHAELSFMPELNLLFAANPAVDDKLSLQEAMKTIPDMKLSAKVESLLKDDSIEKTLPKVRPIYDRYDPAHDGHAAIYRSRFELLRATFAGERRVFADFRAWRKGRGILLANIRAWWNGDLTFGQLILGGKGYATIEEVKPTATSSVPEKVGNGLAEIRKGLGTDNQPEPAKEVESVTMNLEGQDIDAKKTKVVGQGTTFDVKRDSVKIVDPVDPSNKLDQ